MLSEHSAFAETLLAMKKKLLVDAGGKPSAQSSPALTPEIGDEADQAGEDHIREISLLLTGRSKEKLLAIEEALEKIAGETYGICQECGDPIALARLQVMPLAKFCVNCQAQSEKEMNFARQAQEEQQHQQMAAEMEQEENN